MSCDYPIKCRFWNGKQCVEPDDPNTPSYCDIYQGEIDKHLLKELKDAIDRGDWEEARLISKSPFKSW